jgi:hypothetical protein
VRFIITLILTTLIVFTLLTDNAFAKIPAQIEIHDTNTSDSITKSFSDWKHEKIRLAQNELTHSLEKLSVTKLGKTTQVYNIKELEAQVDQDKWSLEMAQDLSSADYVVLYLSGQNNPDRFKAAAAKLSPDETAKILEAYLNAVAARQANRNKTNLPRYSDESL